MHKFEALWTVVSGYRYWRQGAFLRTDFPWYLALGCAGTFVGARFIHLVPGSVLQALVGAAILAVAALLALQREPRSRTIEALDPWRRAILIAAMFVFGLYEGAFGSGNGFFIAAAFFALAGTDSLRTVGMITILAAFWNIVATATHWSYGSLLLHWAVPIGIGACVGAWFGAGMALRSGGAMVRRAIIGLSLLGGATLIWGALAQ